MAEEVKAISAGVKVEDGVLIIEAKLDVIDALEDLALKSENTFDDMFIQLAKAAKGNLDWKGLAKELL